MKTQHQVTGLDLGGVPSRDAYDAVIIGSGPNGLSAAITLARAGCSVLVMEASATIGGGMRSAQLTEPGFVHDICSAIHPLGVASPFFQSVNLEEHGLSWVYSDAAFAHPLLDGRAALAMVSLEETAETLGVDSFAYRRIFAPHVKNGDAIIAHVLAPFRPPRHPFVMARFGLQALRSASAFAKARFNDDLAQGLWAGMAAHAVLPLENLATAGVSPPSLGRELPSIGEPRGLVPPSRKLCDDWARELPRRATHRRVTHFFLTIFLMKQNFL